MLEAKIDDDDNDAEEKLDMAPEAGEYGKWSKTGKVALESEISFYRHFFCHINTWSRLDICKWVPIQNTLGKLLLYPKSAFLLALSRIRTR